MKKLIVASLIGLSFIAVSADWKFVVKDTDGTLYSIAYPYVKQHRFAKVCIKIKDLSWNKYVNPIYQLIVFGCNSRKVRVEELAGDDPREGVPFHGLISDKRWESTAENRQGDLLIADVCIT